MRNPRKPPPGARAAIAPSRIWGRLFPLNKDQLIDLIYELAAPQCECAEDEDLVLKLIEDRIAFVIEERNRRALEGETP